MTLARTIALLLLPCWGIQATTAAPISVPKAGFILADSLSPKIKKKKAGRKQFRKLNEIKQEEEAEEEEEDSDEPDEQTEEDILGKHPIPEYTDFSQINESPRKLEKNYRLREFRAYLPLEQFRKRYKTNNYSSFENPTGIVFRQGDSVSIRMSGKPRTQVHLIIRDWTEGGKESRFPLKPGANQFTLNHAGHAYIDYRDPEPATAPPIKLQISGGEINGVFTRHDDARVWKYLLKHAKSDILDIMGQRTQWILDLKALREKCPDRGPDLVALYDEQMKVEQQLLGWEWEGIHPGNHIMGRVMWKGYMHADGLGGAYNFKTTPGIADVDRVRASGAWGTAHEFGHVNQTRPGMLWAGTTEVTVNLFAQAVNYNFNPREMRIEHENCRTRDGWHLRGGRFDSYVNGAIVDRELWQFQWGQDTGNQKLGERTGDHFVSLGPIWQLYLYNHIVRGDKLFYPRIFKNVRDTDESQWGTGQLRMKFLDRCCDSAQLDFSDFFLEVGMLAVMNRLIEDYGSRWCTITEDMCDQAVAHAAQYPRPESPVIFYLNVNNVEIYRDKLDIKPSPNFKPSIPDQPKRSFTVPVDQWENAVAFEVYNGDKLIRVCIRGLGCNDNKSTQVILPDGATRVMAVQWDGKRYTIYNTSGGGVDSRPDACTGPGQFQPTEKKAKNKKQRGKKK